MNHPIATERQKLSEAERDLMRGMEIQVRALLGGWESSLIDVETEREWGHSFVRDSALQAYIDGEALFFKELDRRIASKVAELRPESVEYKGDVHGRGF